MRGRTHLRGAEATLRGTDGSMPCTVRLKTCFEQITQRCGQWSVSNQAGNPVDSTLVQCWCVRVLMAGMPAHPSAACPFWLCTAEGYYRFVRDAGYDDEAAIPMSFEQYQEHIRFLDAKISTVGPQTPRGLTLQALALTDSLQWKSHRGLYALQAFGVAAACLKGLRPRWARVAVLSTSTRPLTWPQGPPTQPLTSNRGSHPGTRLTTKPP